MNQPPLMHIQNTMYQIMNSSDEVEQSLISASPISPWIGHLFTLQLQQPVSNPDDIYIYEIHVNQTSNLTPAIKINNLLT